MDKELLIKELCSRLPNGIKVLDDMGRVYELTIGNSYLVDLFYGNGDYVDIPIKPYLRPMSSMTEKERKEYLQECDKDNLDVLTTPHHYGIDWLNAHHFDYRGLINKGLALEAPDDIYKF